MTSYGGSLPPVTSAWVLSLLFVQLFRPPGVLLGQTLAIALSDISAAQRSSCCLPVVTIAVRSTMQKVGGIAGLLGISAKPRSGNHFQALPPFGLCDLGDDFSDFFFANAAKQRLSTLPWLRS